MTEAHSDVGGPAPTGAIVGRWPTEARADQFSLVLQAVGISSAVVPMDDAGSGYALIVHAENVDRAREELDKFIRENRGWPPRAHVPAPMTMGLGGAFVFAWLMIVAFIAEQQGSWHIDWLRIGSADASLIRGGEWWRAITALSLHGDAVHLSGNLLFGALFGVMLSQSVGSGAAWLIFVVAGSIGNGVNAWWQPPTHLSIGASTGVFGMLGAQVACDWMRRGRVRLHPLRRWAPIIMGIALLAWFGGSGRQLDPGNITSGLKDVGELQRVDIAAHVFGFCAGLGLGALAASSAPARLLTPRRQSVLAALAIGLVMLAWGMAVR